MAAFSCRLRRWCAALALMLVLCLAGVVGLSAPALADPGLSAPETPSLALILSEAPLPDLSAVSPALDLLGDDAISRTCCKICRKGKACGDSCINRAYTCHRPPGCACDG